MKTRIITAVVAISILIPLCIFSETIAFPIAIATLSAFAVYEVFSCTGEKKHILMPVSVLLGAAFPLIARITAGSGRISVSDYVCVFCIASFVYFILIMSFSVFSKGKFDVKDATMIFAMCFYVISSFTSIVLLRDSRNHGELVYLLAFIGPWVSDSAAYFFGRAFGRHKLIPDVSPKKTVEGSVAGVLFTGIIFAVYGLVLKNITDTFKPSYIVLMISGFVISLVSQFGDLLASLVKRKYEIKDYGRLFPGHGGVLDRFDSVLTTAPLLLAIAEIIGFSSIGG